MSVQLGLVEAARLLGISIGRARDLFKVGKIPADKVDGRWVVRLEDINERIRQYPPKGRGVEPSLPIPARTQVASAARVDALSRMPLPPPPVEPEPTLAAPPAPDLPVAPEVSDDEAIRLIEERDASPQ